MANSHSGCPNEDRPYFLREAFFFRPPVLRPVFFFGTFFPFFRASESPMAMACLRLFTFLPLRPLFSAPFLRRLIALSTSFEALREYLRAINMLRIDYDTAV